MNFHIFVTRTKRDSSPEIPTIQTLQPEENGPELLYKRSDQIISIQVLQIAFVPFRGDGGHVQSGILRELQNPGSSMYGGEFLHLQTHHGRQNLLYLPGQD